MNSRKRVVATVSFAAFIASCTTVTLPVEAPIQQSLPQVELPEWAVGYRQTSMDILSGEESSWEIQSVSDDGKITAKSDSGCEWTVPREWFAGVERWQGCGGTNGRRKLLQADGSLWPLKVGNRTKYSYQLLMDDGERHNEQIICDVVSEGRVEVTMGAMDAYRIQCVSNDQWSTKTRIWYWSPLVGEIKFMRLDSRDGVRANHDVLRSEWI